jgi:O-methyltransferase
VVLRSTHTTDRGAKARLRWGLNFVLGDGALRARINRWLARANFELIVRPPGEIWEPEFEWLISRCEPYTMTSRARLYSMLQATRYVVQAQIPGDIVECGVWRGGSSMVAALTLLGLGDTERKLWLYDTFEGMPEPGERDVGLRGEDAHAEWERNRQDELSKWCYSPLEEVRANMLGTGLTSDRFEFVQGMVEETLPARIPERVALLRLDTDWYASTYHELVHLFPLLSPGGVLILDDYDQWEGVRTAVDEYLRDQGIHLLLNRIDYAGRVAIKP